MKGMALVCGIPHERFSELYWKLRPPYDRGDNRHAPEILNGHGRHVEFRANTLGRRGYRVAIGDQEIDANHIVHAPLVASQMQAQWLNHGPIFSNLQANGTPERYARWKAHESNYGEARKNATMAIYNNRDFFRNHLAQLLH
jgi:hypothetical protein